MNSFNIAIFTEGSLRGGVDTFLKNLIEFWNQNDEITLFINSNYSGLSSYKNLDRSNFLIKKWFNLLLIFRIRSESSTFFGWAISLIYRCLYYPILFPTIFVQLYLYFKKSNHEFLLIVNGGHPGSLYCRTSAIAWAVAKSPRTCVYSVHNVPSKVSPLIMFFESRFDNLLLKSCKKIVTVSNSAANQFYNTAKHFRDWDIEIIHNGIKDISKKSLQSMTKDHKSKFTINNPYIIMLATFEPRKGHNFLLNVFSMVIKTRPDVTLVIMGDGNYVQIADIKRSVVKLGLQKNVVILPFSEEPYFYLKSAALCVSASRGFEPFGLTLVEAMALSIPVVASNVGGMPEVISDSGAGKIYNKDDKSEFANCILTYLNSERESKLAGNLGRKRFLKYFTADRMAEKYKELFLS